MHHRVALSLPGGLRLALTAGLAVVVSCNDSAKAQPLLQANISARHRPSLVTIAPHQGFGFSLTHANDQTIIGEPGFPIPAGTPTWLGGQETTGAGRIVMRTGGSETIKEGASTNDLFGWSVKNVGDIDGMGVDDLAVGAPGVSGDRGAVYVYSGESGFALQLGSTLNGITSGERFGHALASVDYDGDARPELVVAAPLAGNGRVSIFDFDVQTGQFSASVFDRFGAATDIGFGSAVDDVMDADGGGIPDLVVGASGLDGCGLSGNCPTTTVAGRVYVVRLEDGGFHVTISGQAPGDRLGYAVAGVDTDGDTTRDAFAVGAPGVTVGGLSRAGEARLFQVSGTFIRGWTGIQPDDFLGASLADAGDVDGTGPTGRCLAIGTPLINGGQSGRAEVFEIATGTCVLRLDDSGWALSAGRDITGNNRDDVLAGHLGSATAFGVSDVLVVDNTGATGGYTSIQAAINVALPGDVVHVVGTGQPYLERLSIVGKGIHVRGDGWENTVVDATNLSGSGPVLSLDQVNQATVVSGLTLKGGDRGVWCRGSAVVEACRITENTAADGAAVFLETPGFSLSPFVGFDLYEPRFSRCIIDHNTVTGSQAGVISQAWTGDPQVIGAIGSLLNSSFEHCTVTANTATGTDGGVARQGDNVMRFVNSIVAGNSPDLFGFNGGGVTPFIDFSYTCVDPLAQRVPHGLSGPQPLSCPSTCIQADPLLRDPANDDFRLAAGSPCIDAADPSFPWDPDGTPPDMGAIPYVAPAPQDEVWVTDLAAGLVAGSRFGERAAYLQNLGSASSCGGANVGIAAPSDDTAGLDAGAVHVYWSGSAWTGQPDVTLYGETPGARFGFAMMTPRDLDGDPSSCRDVAIGAPFNDGLAVDDGAVYVYLNGITTSGPVAPPIVLRGPGAGALFGWDIDAGDLNGDGAFDLVVGAPGWDRVYVYLGCSAANPACTWPTATPIEIMAPTPGSGFGRQVAFARDHDNDPYDDLIIGAPVEDTNGADAGAVYIHYGSNPFAAGAPDVTLFGEAAGDRFGTAIGGLFNRDLGGTHDIGIGAPYHDANGLDSGRAYILYGPTPTGTNGTVTIATPQTFDGEAAGDRFGWSIDNAGNVVGTENRTDVIVGAPFNDAGGPNAGRAYLLQGTDQPGLPPSVPYAVLTGSAPGGHLGWTVGRIGTFQGDGVRKAWAGAPGAPGLGADLTGRMLFMGEFPPVDTWQGTQEDLRIDSTVNGVGHGMSVKDAQAGASVAFRVWSPGGTFVGTQVAAIGALYDPMPGPLPSPEPVNPNLHFELCCSGWFWLVDPFATFIYPLPAQGMTLGPFVVDPSIVGTGNVLRVQFGVLTPLAQQQNAALTPAHEIHFLP